MASIIVSTSRTSSVDDLVRQAGLVEEDGVVPRHSIVRIGPGS